MGKSNLMRGLSAMLLLALAVGLLGNGYLTPANAAALPERFGAGPELVIYAGAPSEKAIYNPPPAAAAESVQTATFNVAFLPSTGAWPAAARTAFQYALTIWGSLINSTVPISITATWANMGNPNILGGARATDSWANFTGTPISNTWYPNALANKLHNSDLDAASSDIEATFNSGFTEWYFGTDGLPGAKLDFVSVVLHEVGHGLGFAGSMVVGSICGAGNGCWGLDSSYPFAYDRFAYNGSGQSLINTAVFPNPSAALAAQLTSGNVYFAGPLAKAANGNANVKLFAPGAWMQGSSYSHLDEVFNGTPNALMTYSLGSNEANHNPGPVGMGVLKDVGWESGPPVVLNKKLYLPLTTTNYSSIAPAAQGIYGHVSLNSSPVTGVALDLRRYSGGSFTTVLTTLTTTGGLYSFLGAPTLSAGEEYYVRYQNTQFTAGRLWFWGTKYLTSYTAGSTVLIGDFDIADIPLGSPADGASVSLPTTFNWTRRTINTTDGYELNIYGQGYNPWWYTGSLGYVNSYVLNSLPAGLSAGTPYYWEVWVYPPDYVLANGGPYGICLDVNTITLSTLGMAPGQALSPQELLQLRLDQAERRFKDY
jgi:hypothetical protein